MFNRILFAALVGCALAPLAHAEEESAPLPPLQEGVVIEFMVDWPDAQHPTLEGQTNLPEGTLLEIYAKPTESVPTQVKAGKFKVALGGESGLTPGEYEVSVHMLQPLAQPPEVIAIIGKDGENLKGNTQTEVMPLQIDAPAAPK